MPDAGLAQLVEQRIRNAWVGSSSLLTGTIFIKTPLRVFFYLILPARVLTQLIKSSPRSIKFL